MANDFWSVARQTFKREGSAIVSLADSVDAEAFNAVVSALLACKAAGGRIITTGRGNSGAVARKISYVLSSVDIPSLFLAPGEGLHASAGLIQPGDIMLALSRGGETSDVLDLMKISRQKNAKVIAITANPASTMALSCDIMLRVTVNRDVDAHDYLDTSTMIAMIAVFDAIALAIEKTNMGGVSR